MNVWLSKRGFFRELLSVVDRRGYGILPVGEVTGEESWDAMWLKLISARHGWTWCYSGDGRPLLVRPDGSVEGGKPGFDYFENLDSVSHLYFVLPQPYPLRVDQRRTAIHE